MKSVVINAGNIIGFQQHLRKNGGTLIRAQPFNRVDEDGRVQECYAILFLQN